MKTFNVNKIWEKNTCCSNLDVDRTIFVYVLTSVDVNCVVWSLPVAKSTYHSIVFVVDLSRCQRTLAKSLNEFNFECIGSTQTDDEQVIADSLKQFGKLISAIEDERDNMVSLGSIYDSETSIQVSLFTAWSSARSDRCTIGGISKRCDRRRQRQKEATRQKNCQVLPSTREDSELFVEEAGLGVHWGTKRIIFIVKTSFVTNWRSSLCNTHRTSLQMSRNGKKRFTKGDFISKGIFFVVVEAVSAKFHCACALVRFINCRIFKHFEVNFFWVKNFTSSSVEDEVKVDPRAK